MSIINYKKLASRLKAKLVFSSERFCGPNIFIFFRCHFLINLCPFYFKILLKEKLAQLRTLVDEKKAPFALMTVWGFQDAAVSWSQNVRFRSTFDTFQRIFFSQI